MCSQDYVMIGAVRAHVDDKKRAKYGVPPPRLLLLRSKLSLIGEDA